VTPGNIQEEIGPEEWQFGGELEDCGEMRVRVKSEAQEEFRSPKGKSGVLKEFRSPYGPGGKYVWTKVGPERSRYQFVKDPEVEPRVEEFEGQRGMLDMFHEEFEKNGDFEHGWLKVWTRAQGYGGHRSTSYLSEMTKEDRETFWRGRLVPGDVEDYRQEREGRGNRGAVARQRAKEAQGEGGWK
jgi:hypothetical protein